MKRQRKEKCSPHRAKAIGSTRCRKLPTTVQQQWMKNFLGNHRVDRQHSSPFVQSVTCWAKYSPSAIHLGEGRDWRCCLLLGLRRKLEVAIFGLPEATEEHKLPGPQNTLWIWLKPSSGHVWRGKMGAPRRCALGCHTFQLYCCIHMIALWG